MESQKISLSRKALVETPVAPVAVVNLGDGRWFVDFGRAAFGTVVLKINSPDARQIAVHLGEVLEGKTSINRNPGGSRRYRKMMLGVENGRRQYRVRITPDERNTKPGAVLMPVEIGEVMPFRYCELENVPGELTADIRQIAVHYPFDESAAWFASSSRVLNDVWELCKYSMKATSFAGLYVDGDRERIPYEGDAYINQLGHYCVDREYGMAQATAEYLMLHPTWPMEWHLHMPMIAWADYMQTGDAGPLRNAYTDLGAKTLLGLAREDGLVVEDKALMTEEFGRSIHFAGEVRALVDWPPKDFTRDHRFGERDNHEMLPVNSVPNAFHVNALKLMGRIAQAIGLSADARQWDERAERAKRRFNEVFLNPVTGLYVDGEGSQHSSLHSNLFALAFGLVPAERVAGVVAFIKSRGMACSVYAAQFLLEALYKADEEEYALELLTATHDRSWAHMIYTVGSTITLEAWDNKYKENQDYNHAWGAAPANLIPRYLMGIRPLSPGFSRVRIRPQIGGLVAAAIRLPIPQGEIGLQIARGDKAVWQATVSIPQGVTAELHVPTMESRRVTLAGAALPAGCVRRCENRRLVLDLPAGQHKVEVRV